jgi:hypothetical protein
MTALMNALLRLDGEGRQSLRDYKKGCQIKELQCTISAPWSYTVTKSVNYTPEESFEVSNDLIDELLRTATQSVKEDLGDNQSANQLGFEIISRATMDILTNGYRVTDPIGQTAESLSISHASVVTQTYLIDHIDELQKKLLPDTLSKKTSYILGFYCVARDLYPDTLDTCLVHITYEATEIGIVRDGSLLYSTHTPFGSFSLAREITNITSVPLYEAFKYLHEDDPFSFMRQLSEEKRNEIEQVFEVYTEQVAALFRQTGDDLSIPKKVLLHVDLESEKFFSPIIEKAARRCLKSDPLIKLVTPNLFEYLTHEESAHKPEVLTDTAMLVSAHFFHTGDHLRFFEYL